MLMLTFSQFSHNSIKVMTKVLQYIHKYRGNPSYHHHNKKLILACLLHNFSQFHYCFEKLNFTEY